MSATLASTQPEERRVRWHPHDRSFRATLAITVEAVLAAAFVQLLYWHVMEGSRYLLFGCSVVLSAWFGGLIPGLVATGLSAVLVDVFLYEPYGQLTWSLGPILAIGAFLVMGVGISAFGARFHQLRNELARLQGRDS